MKTLISILLLLFSFNAFAQNYNCLQFGPKNYFISGNGDVRGIRVDSIRTIGSDTIFCPYRTTRTLYGTSVVDTFGGSWLGKNVVKKADGTFLFDNLFDTVVIKTQAHSGDSWTFYDDTSIFSYTAVVTSEDTLTISGSIDSIKKFTLSAYRAGIAYPFDPVNNFQIILSKNNGFVQVCDLYTFPYHRPDTLTFNPPAFAYDIRGFDGYLDLLLNNLCMPDLCCHDNPPDTLNSVFHLFPFHNPTLMEIYNADIGNVYETEFAAFDNSTGPSLVSYTYTLDSVLSKLTTPHNIICGGSEYKMHIQVDYSYIPPHFDTMYDPPNTFSRGGNDTTFLANPRAMPEETNGGYILHYLPNFITGLPSSCISTGSYVFPSEAGCVYNGIATVPIADSIAYSIGYGMVSNDFCNPIGTCEDQHYIFCYKDSTACGNFSSIAPHNTAVTSVNLNNTIHIDPNPATDHIDITANSPFTNNTIISIYDVTGRCIYRSPAGLQNGLSVNTSSWVDGLYMVVIQDDKGLLKKEKIVIAK